jgi:hypothetical protein
MHDKFKADARRADNPPIDVTDVEVKQTEGSAA